MGAHSRVVRYNIQGQATPLPSLNAVRKLHACGTIKKSDGETVRQQWHGEYLIIITQYYIVTGGSGGISLGKYASTEILKKEGGTSWQTAASLPSARSSLSGVSLSNGHFMVVGEDCSKCSIPFIFYHNKNALFKTYLPYALLAL